MKFNTWQLIAVTALLLAGVVVAHYVSPGYVAEFFSLFAVAAAALSQKAKDGPPPSDPPSLTLIKGGLAAVLACFLSFTSLTACGAPELTPAQQAELGRDTAQIVNCQIVGKTCKALDGGSCLAKYDACIVDAGLR